MKILASSTQRRTTALMMKGVRFSAVFSIVFVLTVLATSTVVFATTTASGVPWETAMETMIGYFSGQTARLLAALMFIGGAVLWGFSRNEEGFQTVGKVILAAGLMIGAATISTGIFGAVI